MSHILFPEELYNLLLVSCISCVSRANDLKLALRGAIDMKIRSVLFFFFIIAGTLAAAGQGRTVTNADLTKYKEARVKAETDLRENYAKLGFASPEIRAQRIEQAAKEAAELSNRLRAERLEQERMSAEARAEVEYSAALLRSANAAQVQETGEPGFFWYGGRRYRTPNRFVPTQPGYFAGGAFWPTGPATPPRPMWVPRRH
jgi:hypothetical protein